MLGGQGECGVGQFCHLPCHGAGCKWQFSRWDPQSCLSLYCTRENVVEETEVGGAEGAELFWHSFNNITCLKRLYVALKEL